MAWERALPAREVQADIRAGATSEFLMNKYGLTENGLQSFFQKLIAAGVLTQAEFDHRASSVEKVGTLVIEESLEEPLRVVENPRQKQKQPDPPINKGHSKQGYTSKRAITIVLVISAILILVMLLVPRGRSTLVLIRLFLDFATNVAGWLLICCLVAFIIAKIHKAQFIETYFQKVAWAALMIAVLAAIPSTMWTSRKLDGQQVSSAPLPVQMPRFQEIIEGVIANPNFLTPSVRQEFHQILGNIGGSPAHVRELREIMTGVTIVYQPLFWQDALFAVQTGKPHKSRQREDYEKKMIARGLATTERINKNDMLVSKIAARESIPWQDQQVVLEENAIQGILSNLQESLRRVDELFSHAGE